MWPVSSQSWCPAHRGRTGAQKLVSSSYTVLILREGDIVTTTYNEDDEVTSDIGDVEDTGGWAGDIGAAPSS